jgi:hypothetical protein
MVSKIFRIFAIVLFALGAFVACTQHSASVTKGDKPYACIKSNFADLKIRFGTKIKILDSANNAISKYYGYQIDTKGEIVFFDDRNSNSKIFTPLAVISSEDYCRIYHWSKKIVLDQPVLNEIGDTLKFFEFENEKTSIFQRNTWHPGFKTLGSKITRTYIDSVNIIVRKYLKNTID